MCATHSKNVPYTQFFSGRARGRLIEKSLILILGAIEFGDSLQANRFVDGMRGLNECMKTSLKYS